MLRFTNPFLKNKCRNTCTQSLQLYSASLEGCRSPRHDASPTMSRETLNCNLMPVMVIQICISVRHILPVAMRTYSLLAKAPAPNPRIPQLVSLKDYFETFLKLLKCLDLWGSFFTDQVSLPWPLIIAEHTKKHC
jgi:hypothetical protein